MSPMPYRGGWNEIAPENPRDGMRQQMEDMSEVPNDQLTNQMVANFERNKGQIP